MTLDDLLESIESIESIQNINETEDRKKTHVRSWQITLRTPDGVGRSVEISTSIERSGDNGTDKGSEQSGR